MEFEYSAHAIDMLAERDIWEEWVASALNSPDHTEVGVNYNTHYIKAIPEFGGRFLRVVVNPRQNPARIVTLFLDRRMRM